ncbi:DUF167 domain-containing protein [Ferrimicrobium acidiphilum]|uniref:UPF0235 protein AB6A68_06610 n=1 Tax=Ferrimicrobium acidiphilum TaxID=121039 RepID=A0ABV3Y1X5_9ACTN
MLHFLEELYARLRPRVKVSIRARVSMVNMGSSGVARMSVLVKTRRRTSVLSQLDDGTFLVEIKEGPIEGRANEAIIKLIADFGGVSKSKVAIIGGVKSNHKLIALPVKALEALRQRL